MLQFPEVKRDRHTHRERQRDRQRVKRETHGEERETHREISQLFNRIYEKPPSYQLSRDSKNLDQAEMNIRPSPGKGFIRQYDPIQFPFFKCTTLSFPECIMFRPTTGPLHMLLPLWREKLFLTLVLYFCLDMFLVFFTFQTNQLLRVTFPE